MCYISCSCKAHHKKPELILFEVFHPEVLQYTNKYYTTTINTTFILYT
jgi:hypothetical protein